jgi:secreted trypsin-like serine protease
MKKIVIAWILTLTLLFSVVGVVSAITDGELDEGRHPYVGILAIFSEEGYEWRCSGTLVSPTIFLTAGHCTEIWNDIVPIKAHIWFDDDVESNSCPYIDGVGYEDCGDDKFPWGGWNENFRTASTPAQIHVHPDYYDYPWFMHDLGVIELDEPYYMDEYGVLPQLDQLDSMKTKRGKQDVTFTAVGYGLQKSFPDAASWKEVAEKVRMVSYPKLNQINAPGFTGDYSLLLSNNTATGGTCFGDSGGPNFIGKSNVLAGVTSFGMNSTCAGTGGVYRVDRADDLNWLATFGVYPPAP